MSRIRIGINGFGRIGRGILEHACSAGQAWMDSPPRSRRRSRVAEILAWDADEWGSCARPVDMPRRVGGAGS